MADYRQQPIPCQPIGGKVSMVYDICGWSIVGNSMIEEDFYTLGNFRNFFLARRSVESEVDASCLTNISMVCRENTVM